MYNRHVAAEPLRKYRASNVVIYNRVSSYFVGRVIVQHFHPQLLRRTVTNSLVEQLQETHSTYPFHQAFLPLHALVLLAGFLTALLTLAVFDQVLCFLPSAFLTPPPVFFAVTLPLVPVFPPLFGEPPAFPPLPPLSFTPTPAILSDDLLRPLTSPSPPPCHFLAISSTSPAILLRASSLSNPSYRINRS